jgi:hypothetical protein
MRALWPITTKGAEGSVTPATSRPAATTWASYQTDGISTARWGSFASSGRPVAERVGAITQLLLPPARVVTSSHSRPGGNGSGSLDAIGPTGCAAGSPPAGRGGTTVSDAARSTIDGADEGQVAMSRFASAAPIADVSRPRTSSPQRFSARRQAIRRPTDSESTGVHGSGSMPSARNSGGRCQRPIVPTAAFTPWL